MELLFAGSVPKDLLFPDDNEDAFRVDIAAGRVALSDGASESFDSQTWAQQLVQRFVRHPRVDAGWLADAVSDYGRGTDRSSLSWSAQGAFDRGSFATLLGLRCTPKQSMLELLAIGDSLCVLLDGDEVVETFPYTDADEFRQAPLLISTLASLNDRLRPSEFLAARTRRIRLRPYAHPSLMLVTDALGEWVLRGPVGDSRWSDLAAIASQEELSRLVTNERRARRMRVDDTTLIRLGFG